MNKNQNLMNKTQLTAIVAEKTGISKADAAKYVNAVLGTIADTLTEGDKEVAIPDFGRFLVKSVPERQGINPATKEAITIPAHEKVTFKASDNLNIFSRKHSV